jgi:hypothetical protein
MIQARRFQPGRAEGHPCGYASAQRACATLQYTSKERTVVWSGRDGVCKAAVIGPGRVASTIDGAVLGSSCTLPFSRLRDGVRIVLPLADRAPGMLSSEVRFEIPRAVACRIGVPGALPGR